MVGPASATIRTEFFKPEKGRYLHPTANRVISHREAARLQSFPDWYLFEGNEDRDRPPDRQRRAATARHSRSLNMSTSMRSHPCMVDVR